MKLCNFTVWIVASVVTFSLGVALTLYANMPVETELVDATDDWQLTAVIADNNNWEWFFFKKIDAVTKLTGESELRMAALKSGEHEARIWWGFGRQPVQGLILRHVGGQWSAVHVKATLKNTGSMGTRDELELPKSGWDATWEQLVAAGITNLPDASQTACGESGLSGMVVVETRIDNTYRTYLYPNSTLGKCGDAKHLIEIAQIILNEFEPNLEN